MSLEIRGKGGNYRISFAAQPMSNPPHSTLIFSAAQPSANTALGAPPRDAPRPDRAPRPRSEPRMSSAEQELEQMLARMQVLAHSLPADRLREAAASVLSLTGGGT